MSDLANAIEEILPRVRRPSRYMGGELNAVEPDWDTRAVRFVLAYPDLYEVGTSHLGLAILYAILNAHPGAGAERVYCPDLDMEAELRARDLPLFSLESRHPLGDFDFVGITLQYELTYTNVINLLDLGDIPIRSCDRGEGDPFVLGGGPCAHNAEPVAPFFDLLLLGDGEEAIVEIADLYAEWREEGGPGGRGEFLRRAAGIPGVYVPSGYRVSHSDGGALSGVIPKPGFPSRVKRRILRSLEGAPVPTCPVVPFLEAVHDRAVIELFRGCTRGCRFCMAGAIYRPVRERDPGTIHSCAREILGNTGYEEISLVSLSSSDYSAIDGVTDELAAELGEDRTSLSLPSLRVDHFSVELAGRIREVRNTGITLAPEAGTQRLRDVINKGVTDEDFRSALKTAFESGCDRLKLYFMVGLPTETEADVRGIADMVDRARRLFEEFGRSRRSLKLNLSVACFIPKPHTPFQWEEQLSEEAFEYRVGLLRTELPRRGVKLSFHDPGSGRIEGVFARGDRRLAPAILRAHALGARLEGWTEHFDPRIWEQVFRELDIDASEYLRARDLCEILPWDHTDPGISRRFLAEERARAYAGEVTPDCRWGPCSGCGVCSGPVTNEVIAPGRRESS